MKLVPLQGLCTILCRQQRDVIQLDRTVLKKVKANAAESLGLIWYGIVNLVVHTTLGMIESWSFVSKRFR